MSSPFTIRPARPDDAQALTDYMIRLVGEPHNNMVLDPGQWTLSVEEEREFLRECAANPNKLFLIAEIDGTVAGCSRMNRLPQPTERHVATFGVSVDAAHRRKGIGRALIETMLAWAREQGVRRVELQVFARNAPGIALYKKLGFVEEGLHKMALYKQGVWVDEYTMAMILSESP